MIDVLYLCHGRLEFTKASLANLIAHTPWEKVNEFVVYNDAAPDHPATFDYLNSWEPGAVRMTVRNTNLGSPVGVMNHFLNRSHAEMFAKIDNDIIVPSGWFDALSGVMDRFPQLQLLGMEPSMSGVQPFDSEPFDYVDSTHIGGVGMMRRHCFERHGYPVPDGRFGFTEWQHTFQPQRGWIRPDLRMFSLDFLPVEPWAGLTERYKQTPGLQRTWPSYDPKMSHYWDWWIE